MKIIVSRTDRAGDLILTTPVLRELKKNFPDARIHVHVRSYTAPLLRLCKDWFDEVIIDEDYSSVLLLGKKFSQIKADQIVIVHPSARVITAAFLARIPVRTGRASNIWQFMLNVRKVQKRSKNETHESIYNLRLIDDLVNSPDQSPPVFTVPEEEKISGQAYLKKSGMQDEKPILLHPGHGGSAFNLTPDQYAQLAESLLERNFAVLISLGPGEESLKSKFSHISKGKLSFLTDVPDLGILGGVMLGCSAFISGSTGPMHLAAALQLPIVAFFPPVPAMTPTRWGPLSKKQLVLMPKVEKCDKNCPKCTDKGCMLRIDTDQAVQWLERTLRHESSSTD
jgi:ADP-heptose:LPS heptosyltransferase